MAEYQITYWREFPSMVTAREGRRNTHKIELSQRFQLVIDEAAMRLEMTGTDAYLEQWRRDTWQEQTGSPTEVAEAIATAVEAAYPAARLREMLQALTNA